MKRRYRKSQTESRSRRVPIVDRAEALSGRVTVELPISLAEVVSGMSEAIERLAGEAGLRLMGAVLEAEVDSLAGRKGRHDPDRAVYRWGSQGGYAVLAGKKIPLRRLRVRNREGREVSLESYSRFQSPPRRQRSIMKKLVHGISTRKYEQAVEDFADGYGISRSAVSRELVQAARGMLQERCERRIDELGRLVVLMIDGQVFAGEHVIAALGVDETGRKHILGLVQGSTENSAVVSRCASGLDDLIERGLDPTQRMLSVLDGAKALHKAVKKTFGECCEVQRCQLHKRRNVADHLSDEYRRSVDQRMRTAYAMKNYKEARAQLLKTVAWLDRINVSAAASLREGLEETLTLHRLGLPDTLRKSLSSTNLIESAFSVARDVTGRVKRWRGGDMRLRWSAAGLLEAEKNFRRIRGCKLMPKLLIALDRGAVAESATAA